MRKKLIQAAFIYACCHMTAWGADLLEVYQQAQASDPIYQQAISQRLATKEGVPISLAALLPNVGMTLNPTLTRSGFSGANVDSFGFVPRNTTTRYYELALTATQTVFNYTQFATLAGSMATSKGADATLNAALQSLMTRVATAYFNVLRDEDNLSYNLASKIAYSEQLSQVKEQYEVGIKTITDVYTAQASYDTAVASYIAAETTLSNDRENLRVITGTYYPKLAPLSENFPLVRPKPANVETWAQIAQQQNWSIKAAQYNADTARQVVQQQFGGHLPTVTVQGQIDRIYTNNMNGYRSISARNGPTTETDRQIMFNINVPVFEGGGVTAQTHQAMYNYQTARQSLEQTTRNTLNTARQSFLGVIAGISQIEADRQAIKSSISSLDGMEASYRVGTETLVDVLNQQQKVFQAQTQYATDRYAFVNNVLALKEAAGTLSFDDLRTLNAWLGEKHRAKSHYQPLKHVTYRAINRSPKKATPRLAKKHSSKKKIISASHTLRKAQTHSRHA